MNTDYAENHDLSADALHGAISSKHLSASPPWHDDKCNLHDCVALGAFEYGLPYLKMSTVDAEPLIITENSPSKQMDSPLPEIAVVEGSIVHTDASSEIHRLPLLLRILSHSRPLSSIQSLGDLLRMQKDGTTSSLDESLTNDDPLVDDIVARLEDRAAIYAAAERVQMVSCHLAPAACHRVSKLSPLSKQNRNVCQQRNAAGSSSYDTTELEIVAQNLLHSSSPGSKKQRRLSLAKQSSVNAMGDVEGMECEEKNDDDDLRGRRTDDPDDSDCDSKAEATTLISTGNKKRKRTKTAINTRSLSISNLSEDSPEYNVLKVLHELTSLIITSLQKEDEPEKLTDKEDFKHERTSVVQPDDMTFQKGGSFALPKMDDSILAQPLRRVKSVENSSSAGTAIVTSSSADVASTVVALMHHAPVLQHRHVASALCRAALPQTPVLISRMGANCPASVPCLLDGCITVYCLALAKLSIFHNSLTNLGVGSISSGHLSNIVSSCVQSVRLLAKLSPRETHRTISTLRLRNAMVELQLELMIQHDALAAVLLLNQQLSSGAAILRVTEVGPVAPAFSTLSSHLHHNVPLLRDTFHFISGQLSAEFIPIAFLSITLSAYIRIISQVSMTLFLSDDGISIVLRILASLRSKLELLREDVAQNLRQAEMPCSGPEFNLLVVSMISTYAVLLSEDKCQELITGAQLKGLANVSIAPLHARVLLTRLSLSLCYGDSDSLYDIIGSSITYFKAKKTSSPTSQNDDSFRSMLKKLCRLTDTLSGLNRECIENSLSLAGNSTLLYPSVALQLLNYESNPRARSLLEHVLKDTEAVLLFLQDPLVLDFFEKGVSIGLHQEEAKLPIVTPVQIQTLASTLLAPQWEKFENPVLQFLMQLLYCFYFYEQAPCSPFRIDPRELPLNRILEISVRCKTSRSIDSIVCAKLTHFIDVYCPEVRRFHRFKILKSRERWFHQKRPTILVKKNKEELTCILRQTIASVPQFDADGLFAEHAFLEASLFLSDADLMSASVGALVSCRLPFPLYFTYPMLYRDPLVVLKCPLTVWNCRGTRRIMLAVLSRLLATNEFIVRKDSICQEAANELLSSRNEIVLRCLLRAITLAPSRLERSARVCGQTCGLIRRVVASNEGLTALLIKQGLIEAEIDWLTESVPELALDLSKMQGILADKSSLSAANRLVVADCCVWIAIAYGHRSDGFAEGIVHASLSQLISSFFLILGPIGVPVSALIGHGTDLDATQVARKAAFRMLTSLQKIKLFRTRLKVETLSILQKFLGMCKGESIVGSLQTSISGSQKSLLKDLVEIIRKAMESMGLASNTQD